MMERPFACRPGCAGCCIAPSISSALPGLPEGKPAGMACPALTAEGLCGIHGKPERPAVCASLKAEPGMCGASREEALALLARLEELTAPRESRPFRNDPVRNRQPWSMLVS